MTAYKIYTISNISDPEVSVCLGATRHKYLSTVWNIHRLGIKIGTKKDIYDHIRATGVQHYKCLLLEEGEGNDAQMNEALQKFTLDLKPTHTLAKPVKVKVTKERQQVDKTFDELKAMNNKNKVYQKGYQPAYYALHRESIRAKQAAAYKAHPRNNTEFNNNIRENKRYYCDKCNVACVAQSALDKHNNTKKHLRLVQH